jgi:hypothetical protein
MRQSGVSVRGDDDQIRFQFLRRFSDRLVGNPEMHFGAALAVTLSSAFLQGRDFVGRLRTLLLQEYGYIRDEARVPDRFDNVNYHDFRRFVRSREAYCVIECLQGPLRKVGWNYDSFNRHRATL